MSPVHHDVNDLAAFFDPVVVASILKDIFDDRSAIFIDDKSVKIRAVPAVATAHDQEVLERLLSRDVYAYWRQSGYLGSYCMTFMLRNAVTFLALAAHERACPVCDLEQVFKKYYFFSCRAEALECLDTLAENPAARQSAPLLGFSALGIHFFYRKTGACRAFDAYETGLCAEPAKDFFCHKHMREAWWEYEGPGASTQADMFRFYARRENLHAYEEHQLEELVGRFWSRMKKFRQELLAPDTDVSEALAFFGYPKLADLCTGGQLKLRRRYAERARQLHPDFGGRHESFLELKKHYEVLRSRLSCENAIASA